MFMSKQEAHFWFLVFGKLESLDDYEDKKTKEPFKNFRNS
ncbi:hypothetical protein LEP1GSC043_2725 [Leptospira weilii str. Ecochallenge]|uniref:Uncharacterized protein n=1 Tax=Leptospira weilii str. Ecochallenge TaxID=1049986 RepID=N1U558_9LEPT|nr:hypothetical protein LEP1GSC043_2725 [Leptospira weilii str. Ecochallenge]